MNTEDFVTYEQAVKLKECGFDWRCQNHYIKQGCIPQKRHGTTALFYDYNKSEVTISAPTLTQAAKWLREVKRIEVIAFWDYADKAWRSYYGIMDDLDIASDAMEQSYPSYEKALSVGIDAALELIKEKL